VFYKKLIFMKKLELNQMEVVDGGDGGCAVGVASAVVGVIGFAVFIAFPPAGLLAGMLGGAAAGMGLGTSIAGSTLACGFLS